MSEELTNFLAIIGILFLIVIVGFTLIVILSFIRQKIDELKNYYRIKHRFDKPPLADCYCIDCKSYNRKNERCYRLNRSTADIAVFAYNTLFIGSKIALVRGCGIEEKCARKYDILCLYIGFNKSTYKSAVDINVGNLTTKRPDFAE